MESDKIPESVGDNVVILHGFLPGGKESIDFVQPMPDTVTRYLILKRMWQ